MADLAELNHKLGQHPEGLFLENVSFETYIAHEGISRSELGIIDDLTPFHYKWKKEQPDKSTQALLIGRATHKLILERDTFDEDYIECPDLNLRKKDDKAFLVGFKKGAAEEGREVLMPAEMKKVRDMGDALAKQKGVSNLIKDGVAERSIFREVNGQILKTRPDYYIESRNLIVDLKTARDITYQGFMRSIVNYLYFVQVAYYIDSVAHFVGDPPRFLFIAIESHPPYQAAVYEIDAAFVMVGRAQYIRNLALIQECAADDNWPSFKPTPIEMPCPDWLWEGFKKRAKRG